MTGLTGQVLDHFDRGFGRYDRGFTQFDWGLDRIDRGPDLTHHKRRKATGCCAPNASVPHFGRPGWLDTFVAAMPLLALVCLPASTPQPPARASPSAAEKPICALPLAGFCHGSGKQAGSLRSGMGG